MRLSIITPYYNTLEYTLRLAERLQPQLTDNVEWIIVDDGCNEKALDNLKAKVIHLSSNSGGASRPRNVGLDVAKGDYIAFIDSDDIVRRDYIEKVLKSLNTDIIYISWKSQVHNIIIDKEPPQWNCAVWCRIYKKEIIGNVRFRDDLRIAEDYDFNKRIHPQSTGVIRNQIYYYNIREGSLVRSKK